MSLASIRAKEAKGKRKTLPKLKAILANPYRARCPSLDSDDLSRLQQLLAHSMNANSFTAADFFKASKIHLGLQSSLRAINNSACSCVLMSSSIKPKYLLSLIARNVNVKNETCSVYVQNNLEDFTKQLFNIKSLIMVFPKNIGHLSEDLQNWIQQHLKSKETVKPALVATADTVKTKNPLTATTKVPNKAVKQKKQKLKQESPQNTLSKNEMTEPISTSLLANENKKQWSGDYISFSNGSSDSLPMNQLRLKDDRQDLIGALTKLTKAVKHTELQPPAQAMQVDETPPQDAKVDKNMHADHSSDSDDFLGEYKSLIVHKIQPNANAKPKKKRKKNKKNIK